MLDYFFRNHNESSIRHDLERLKNNPDKMFQDRIV